MKRKNNPLASFAVPRSSHFLRFSITVLRRPATRRNNNQISIQWRKTRHLKASLIPKYSNILLSETWISNFGDKYRCLFWSLPHGEISEPSQLYFSRKSLCPVKYCRWQHEMGKNQNCLSRENTKFASHYCCVFFPRKSVNNWKLLKLSPLLLSLHSVQFLICVLWKPLDMGLSSLLRNLLFISSLNIRKLRKCPMTFSKLSFTVWILLK